MLGEPSSRLGKNRMIINRLNILESPLKSLNPNFAQPCPRQLGVFGNKVQELRQVPLDDRIQRCFLGLVAPVANKVGGCIQTGPGVD